MARRSGWPGGRPKRVPGCAARFGGELLPGEELGEPGFPRALRWPGPFGLALERSAGIRGRPIGGPGGPLDGSPRKRDGLAAVGRQLGTLAGGLWGPAARLGGKNARRPTAAGQRPWVWARSRPGWPGSRGKVRDCGLAAGVPGDTFLGRRGGGGPFNGFSGGRACVGPRWRCFSTHQLGPGEEATQAGIARLARQDRRPGLGAPGPHRGVRKSPRPQRGPRKERHRNKRQSSKRAEPRGESSNTIARSTQADDIGERTRTYNRTKKTAENKLSRARTSRQKN